MHNDKVHIFSIESFEKLREVVQTLSGASFKYRQTGKVLESVLNESLEADLAKLREFVDTELGKKRRKRGKRK